MFIMDVPPEPIREVPVLMAQVEGCAGVKCRNARPVPEAFLLVDILASNNLTATGSVLADVGAVTVPATQSVKYDAAYSVCKAVVPVSHEDFAIANVVLPMTSVTSYLLSHGVGIDRSKPLKIILSESPTHGELWSEGYANGVYAYHPNEGYLGPDQMTFVIEAQGMKFKVIETVWVANVAPEYGGCPADYKLPPATTGNDKGSALDIIELPADGLVDTEALAKLHGIVSFSMGAGLPNSGNSLSRQRDEYILRV